ncbi:unnamed protein product, partial [Didymodactylos carnosus]
MSSVDPLFNQLSINNQSELAITTLTTTTNSQMSVPTDDGEQLYSLLSNNNDKVISDFLTNLSTTSSDTVDLNDNDINYVFFKIAHIYACSLKRLMLTHDTDPGIYFKKLGEDYRLQIAKRIGCTNGSSMVVTNLIPTIFYEPVIDIDAENCPNLLYIWTSLITGKHYIGQTNQTLLDQTKQHFQEALEQTHESDNREFNHAIRCHSQKQWDLRILRFVYAGENINNIKHYYIDKLNCKWPGGYNMEQMNASRDGLADDEVDTVIKMINGAREKKDFITVLSHVKELCQLIACPIEESVDQEKLKEEVLKFVSTDISMKPLLEIRKPAE